MRRDTPNLSNVARTTLYNPQGFEQICKSQYLRRRPFPSCNDPLQSCQSHDDTRWIFSLQLEAYPCSSAMLLAGSSH